ncbi:hypothetical protein J2Z69_000304 [Paenibacillus shirakamiensis]|uniref:Uncharacterized protein n=1 Tax=Paenibacillus shirakamiensis TaxID=1265935 RepID=A0ABS4JDZ6_9BACL|nr:hypothetical protein [Paenibacillus shirakamiensis]MBP1999285.1 hypothetical protein [Paenibacillus shirakamiensis]
MIFITFAITAIIVLAILISLNVRNKSANLAKERVSSNEEQQVTEQPEQETDAPKVSDTMHDHLEEPVSDPYILSEQLAAHHHSESTEHTQTDIGLQKASIVEPSQRITIDQEKLAKTPSAQPAASITDQDYRAAIQRLLEPPQEKPVDAPNSASKDQDFRNALKKLSEQKKDH